MNERLIILETLLLIEKGEDYGSRIIKDVLDKYAYLSRQHRSFIKRVLEGTLERKIELDYIINQFSKTPTASMKPVILCILRMSVYQLKYMDQVPESAVCNEAVKLAEKKGFFKLKGFVNGVLRNIARNLVNIKYPDISITYSVPDFLYEHFKKYYGDNAEQICASFLRDNITTIRPNLSKTTLNKLTEALKEDGASLTPIPDIPDIPSAKSPKAYLLSDYNLLSDLKAFRDGLFIVQDQSAMLPVELAPIKAGDTVIDVCAAPGGKTIQIIDKLCQLGGGNIYSFDISEYKTDIINENLERCDFGEANESVKVKVDVCDATEFHEDYVNQADVLIADLPCSGLGIIGRKSDIKYNVTQESMESLVMLQREILCNVVKYVKDGGTLMYSTCTLNPEENENQVKWMEESFSLKCEEMYQIFPSEYRDGFFAARMVKQ